MFVGGEHTLREVRISILVTSDEIREGRVVHKSRMSPAKSIQVTCGVNCGGTRGIDQRRGPCFALSPRSPGRDEGRKVVGGVGLEIVVGVESSACRRVAGCGIEVWDEAAGEGGLTVHGRGASSLKHRLRHGTEHIHLHPPFDLLTKPPNYPLWLKWPSNSALLPRSTTFLFFFPSPQPCPAGACSRPPAVSALPQNVTKNPSSIAIAGSSPSPKTRAPVRCELFLQTPMFNSSIRSPGHALRDR
jgi:hypothetical protein